MKGLLLKDWYMMKSYCRSYLLIVTVFLAVSFMGDSNLFFAFYPCILCSMIPITLHSYDERSHWLQYSASLPCSRAQIVSAKYLIGLATSLVMFIVTGIAQVVRMRVSDAMEPGELIALMVVLLMLALLMPAITFPVIFKWGVEKGRIVYYVVIGVICAGGVIIAQLVDTDVEVSLPAGIAVPAICAAVVGLYAFSWYLSIVFFKNREL